MSHSVVLPRILAHSNMSDSGDEVVPTAAALPPPPPPPPEPPKMPRLIRELHRQIRKHPKFKTLNPRVHTAFAFVAPFGLRACGPINRRWLRAMWTYLYLDGPAPFPEPGECVDDVYKCAK